MDRQRTLYDNGQLIAGGKAEWLRVESAAKAPLGRVIGFSEAWQDGGNLVGVDEYDSVDRAGLPPPFVADARMTARATLYQLGPDHRVHVVRAAVAGSF